MKLSMKKTTKSKDNAPLQNLCQLPKVPVREFAGPINPFRVELIHILDKKWVNGTILHYYFFDKDTDGTNVRFTDGSSEWRTWTTTEEEKAIVRNAFKLWKDIGLGLEFREVDSREEAEIRIGFMRGDGAWSYVGRDIIDLNIGRNNRTMNFGWDLTRHPREIDTAIHEIGHTLGFPHEHQNPNAGIVWDEEAVYDALAAPPNNWSRETTYFNIIRKLPADSVMGSTWDPDSVMHYPFGPGLIIEPENFRGGVSPAPGLSEKDKSWALAFYPTIEEEATPLYVVESVKLTMEPGGQKNFVIQPLASRRYTIRTFGNADTVIVLFEEIEGELVFVAGSDDSAKDDNAEISIRLRKGTKYVLRIRLYFEDNAGETAVMYW